MAKFEIEKKSADGWEQAGQASSMDAALEIVGPDPDWPAGWFISESADVRVHVRKDSQWKVVEILD